MGGSESKAVVKKLSQDISNIVSQSVQECTVASDQTQVVTSNNWGFKLFSSTKVVQQTDIASSCFSDTKKQTEIQNKIIDRIAQGASGESVALLGAFGQSEAEALTNLTHLVKTNVTMENIQRTYNAIRQQQSVSFNNSGVVLFESADILQGSKVFSMAVLQILDNAGVFNQIQSYIDQETKSEQGGLFDFITDWIWLWVLVVIVFVVVVGGVSAVWLLRGSRQRSPAAPAAPATPAAPAASATGA